MMDIVNLTQHPVARIVSIETAGHEYRYPFCRLGGWLECSEDAHILCAHDQVATTDLWVTKKMVECLYSRDFYDPTNARVCTEKVTGLDYQEIYNCSLANTRPAFAKGGRWMLEQSAELAKSRNVTAVPTIFLNGQNVGHTLTLEQICSAYTGTKPPGCSGTRAAPAAAALTHNHLPCEI
jgi:hypothetical protein